METREESFIDKSGWGGGPWHGEPDKIQWTDEATGLPCLIVRNGGGALCGYVGVAEGHPFFGVEYNGCAGKSCGESYCDHAPDHAVEVHGGLTFSGFCQEGEHGICHVPAPGEPERVWWLGFDCGHFFDASPAYDARCGDAYIFNGRDRTYRTVDYVRDECARLAAQLKARS